MRASLPKPRSTPGILAAMLSVLALLSLCGTTSQAGTFAIGSADGSFETGLGGMVSTGDVRLVSAVGILRPTQGEQAVFLTTTPDTGAAPSDADISLLRIDQVTIPAATTQLRLDYVFLTNELTPSKLNDRFTVTLVLVDPAGTETLLQVDTFAAPMYPAPWTGYMAHTGFRSLVADVSAHAGSGEAVTLELRLSDVGDGRGDSAVLLDNMQLTATDEPQACANYTYAAVNPGDPLFLDASCSTTANDSIVEYRWVFGDGTIRIGRFVEHAYSNDGVYQPTLTVTDAAGQTSTATFLVLVGAGNHTPQIVSSPRLLAAAHTPYRYAVGVVDPELPFGDVLTYALIEAPLGMIIDSATGIITWTPAAAPQQAAVTVQVTDSQGLSQTQSFTVTVGPEVYIIAADDASRLYYARSNGDGTFADYHFIEDTGDHTEGGAAIADFDGDGDFDFVSGHSGSSSIALYYYEKQGTQFAAPVLLGTVGDTATPAGDWLMDMAAADFNNDSAMDFVVNGNSAHSWLFLQQGQLTFSQTTFLGSDFESDTTPWGGAQCHTAFARDPSTAASGTGSMRIFATGANACLSVAIRPADWRLLQGPTLTFAYRIPPGVPVGLLAEVSGHGWLSLGRSPTALAGPYPTVAAVQLDDDDQWHTVSIDLYNVIRQQWPDAGQILAFMWWTAANAAADAQFWFDDFYVTRRTYVSGFDISLLPDTGTHGRGMDAADVDADGNIDIVRGRWSDGHVHLYRGDGTGQFSSAFVTDAGIDPFGLALADFNSDSRIDLIVNAGSSGDAQFFQGNGDSTFQVGIPVASLDTNSLAGYAAYDFDNDGKQDMVLVNHIGRQVLFYPGHDDATFGVPQVIGTTAFNTLGVGAPAGRVIGQPFSVVTLTTETIQASATMTFDARGSFDDGTIVGYDWQFGDGTIGNGPVVSHTYTTEGTYMVLLTITDDAGKRDRRRQRVTVQGAPPVAVLSAPSVVDETAASLGQWTVFFDASGSTDDGGIASYAWDFGDGATATGLRPTHVYTAPGVYTVTLTVTDQAAQSVTAQHTLNVTANAPPLAQHGGPYVLTEAEALAGKWLLVFDATASTDDHGIQRYTIDFGDGSQYTTGFSQGAEVGYFAAGTDLYGYSVSGARPDRIVASEDTTEVEVINLATREVIATNTLNRFGTWEITPGDGIAFKIEASKPVVMLEHSSVFPSYATFMPSLDTRPVGREFLFHLQGNQDFFVFAIEDTVVRFFDAAGTLVASNTLQAGTAWQPTTLSDTVYHVVASGKIAMQTSGGNAYTTVPASSGEAVGRQFYMATQGATTGAFAVLAYDAAAVEVFDLDSGQSLYTHSLAAAEVWYQSGVGTRRLRLESTGDVEVWAGDTEGGTGILDLGDGISITAGRGGTEFYLHTLRDGVVIFAPNHGTTITIDDGALVTTLKRDGFLRLAPSDFPTTADVHHITASVPVLIQTLGAANGLNDYGTYLGGTSARHRYTNPGTYPLTLTVTDYAGQTHSTSTTVTVQAADPPVAVINAPAVADETFASGGLWIVPFDASGSTDDFGVFAYAWDFGDGSTGTGIDPGHVYTAPGTYTVTLTVTDHAGQQTTTTFTVLVTATAPPVADAGGPYVFGEEAASFGAWRAIFDGSGSSDDAGILTYTWDFGDGMADDFNAGHADGWTPVAGTWEVAGGALRQTDTSLGRAMLLSADEPARDYTVAADVRIVEGAGEEVILIFRALDVDNRYEFLLRGRGLNDVVLDRRVHNNATTMARAFLPFAVVPDVVYRLQAEVNGSAITLSLDGTPVLQATDSTLPRGSVGFATYLTHARFDNLVVSHRGAGPTPTHTYTQAGTYTATLTVTDNALQSHTVTVPVTVGQGAPPVAAAGGPYTVERGWRLTCNASGSTDDVHLEQYHWDFGDGTSSAHPNPVHIYDAEGTYTVALTVTDNVLQSHTAGTTVAVITGNPPLAAAGGPYQGAVNGPAVFFDASGSQDDYGIANYVWDVDATVDTDGDGNPTNDRDAVGRQALHTYTAAGNFTATLTVMDGAGQTATATATVSVVPNLPPRVITVPWVSADVTMPHETFNGKEITLKGVVSDADPVTYAWDFGDGTTSGLLPVPPDGHHRLEAKHTYPDVPAGTPFVATLSVTDSQGSTGSDTYRLIVKEASLHTEVNVAIDEGLWYAHTQQDRATGQWHQRDEVATTASMVNAFEANAHRPTGDPGADPYVTTVRLGLTYILNQLMAESIAVQPAGDPDTNGNGLGIRVRENNYPYQGGMVMDALIASGAPLRVAASGPAEVRGRRYFDIVQDMVDAYAYGQYDDDGVTRGGWRYNWNQFPDNSASQWGAVGLMPARRNFGNRVPAFITAENLIWLGFSQDLGSGHFGYTDTVGVWGSMATTASGMVQLAMDGVLRTAPRWTQAEHYLRRRWETPSGNDALLHNFYAMFALTKAMRLAQPAGITHLCAQGCVAEPLDWYGDPSLGFAPTLLARQDPDGGWTQPPGLTGSQFWERNLISAWSILMLTPSLFEVAPEAAAGPDRVWGVDVPLTFDASGSFHPDPFGHIVLYEWDVNGDGTFESRSSSPTTSVTYTSADYPAAMLPLDITVTLRVTDARGTSATDTATVTLAVPPHPPLAAVGGPYTCTAGLPCTLDGSGSLDIDPTDVITVYAWELDGVGVPDFAEAFGPTVTHVFPTPGTLHVGLRVTDNGVLNDVNGNGQVDDNERLSDQAFTTVTVVGNQPPVAAAGGPYSSTEGTPIALDGTGSSDANGDALIYSWDLDSDGVFGDATGAAPLVTFPDNGTFTVVLQVSDGLEVRTATATVTVSNAVPAVDAGPTTTVAAGSSFAHTGSFSDTGTDTWTATVDYGDGTGSQPLLLQPDHTFDLSHVYVAAGTYTVVVTVRDDDGDTGSATTTVIVDASPCDLNGDGHVDTMDIQLIMAARNTLASGPTDPRDQDGDGMITVLDARICVLQCDNPRCAP